MLRTRSPNPVSFSRGSDGLHRVSVDWHAQMGFSFDGVLVTGAAIFRFASALLGVTFAAVRFAEGRG